MSPDPRVALQIGSFSIFWYGIIITTGIIAATYIATIEAKRRGEDPNIVWDGVILVVFFGLVGARLYHVFSTPNDGSNVGWDYYRQNPFEILMIRNGGLGIYGGIIGGLIGILILAVRKHLKLMRWLDIVVPGLALAQSIGRWGNFVNQELYGGPTGSPWWGVTILPQHRVATSKIDFTDLSQYPLETRFHPTFFYESVWNFAGFLLLMWFGRRFERRLRDGDVFALYLIWYGLGRSWVELFFRPDAWTIGALPTAVWISLGVIAAGALLILANHLLLPRLRPATAS